MSKYTRASHTVQGGRIGSANININKVDIVPSFFIELTNINELQINGETVQELNAKRAAIYRQALAENFTESDVNPGVFNLTLEQLEQLREIVENWMDSHCHCGAPLGDNDNECADCTTEYQEFLTDLVYSNPAYM